jgi:predicted ester cyclase
MSNRHDQRAHCPARRVRALRACAVAGLAAVAAAAQAHAAGPAAATRIACAADDPNLKAYLEMTEKMFVPRDASVAARYYAPQFVSHNQDSGGGDSTTLTPARFKEVYEASKRTFGERGFRNDLIICGGDYVVARVTMTSKMTGPMFGQPPTGKTAVVSATDTYRFKDGKVVERWGNNDGISMLQQLGLQLPPPAATSPAGAAPAKGSGGK